MSSSVACHVTFNTDVFLLFMCVVSVHMCVYALPHVSAWVTESKRGCPGDLELELAGDGEQP